MTYLEKLKKYPEDFEYCLGASGEEIKSAEKQLDVVFPKKYKQFLSECGMCNFGDAHIEGIFKTAKNIEYPIVDITMLMRKEVNLPNNFIVLQYETDEWIDVLEISDTQENEDGGVYGVEIHYDENGNNIIEKPDKKSKHFNSFDDYFNDFITLAEI